MRASRLIVVAAAVLVLGWALRLAAHEIPADVLVHMIVKPEQSRMHVVVRVPLAAARDFDFPTRGPGYLDLARADAMLRDAAILWVSNYIEVFEDDRRLAPPRLAAVRVSLPSDKSFASYEEAIAHIAGPRLPDETQLIWNQALLDILLEYSIDSDRAKFAIRPALARLGIRVVTVLRFLPPGGTGRALEYAGDPGLIRLDPSWRQAAGRFIALGFRHILDGTDHLLFLLCLVIPFSGLRLPRGGPGPGAGRFVAANPRSGPGLRAEHFRAANPRGGAGLRAGRFMLSMARLGPLVLIVTSFTVAHSITLIASAFDLAPGALWFPPLIETLIAVSIVYMALENIVLLAHAAPSNETSMPARRPAPPSGAGASRLAGTSSIERRWIITFAFGLVHGFGFSFGLRNTLQFAGSHLLTSLLSFNLGVELGQLVVLVVLISALNMLFRFVVAERIGTIILSALAAHTAWHWMTERADTLRQFGWPAVEAGALAGMLRALMALLVLGAVWWFIRNRHGERSAERSASKADPT